MTRRASLPGVDELFRSSKSAPAQPDPGIPEEIHLQVAKSLESQSEAGIIALPAVDPSVTPIPAVSSPAAEPPSAGGAAHDPAETLPGRRAPRHDEKVTFYCTASDLNRIERARLSLRADHKLASDRGRIVRAALAEILDDFERRGADSALVLRLRNRDAGPDRGEEGSVRPE